MTTFWFLPLIAWATSAPLALTDTKAPYAQEARRTEEEAHAILLSRLGDYTVWPERNAKDSAQPFIIGILGEFSARRELLLQVANKRIKGRRIEVVWLASIRPSSLQACDLLFICESEQDRLREVLSICRSHPILTVAGAEGSARAGVMVGLFVKEGRLKLQVNLIAARAAGIELSPAFLARMRTQIVGGPDEKAP